MTPWKMFSALIRELRIIFSKRGSQTLLPYGSHWMPVDRRLAQQRLQSSAAPELPQDRDQDLKISDACVKQLKSVVPDTRSFLRVLVEGGGCSGFQYKFDVDDEIHEDDMVFERDGVRVVVDSESLHYLKGSTVHYSRELIRSAFVIADNPQSAQGCSCGSSFSLKD